MDEYLICAELFSESSIEELEELTGSGEAGFLLLAAKILVLPSEDLNSILLRAQFDMLSSRTHDIHAFNLSPFVEKVELYDDVVEYHYTNVKIYSLAAARKLWDTATIAKALNDYDEWSCSSDAKLDTPTNRVCIMLRRCVAEATIAFGILHPQEIKANETQKQEPNNDDRMKEKSNSLLTFEKAAQIIISDVLEGLPCPTHNAVAERLHEAGFEINPETYNRRLSGNDQIRELRRKAKRRPDKTSGKAYEKWLRDFLDTASIFGQPLIQSDNAGMEEPKKTPPSRPSDSAKKKVDEENKSDNEKTML